METPSQDQSLLLERQQRISIEERGNLYTETKVRGLYRNKYTQETSSDTLSSDEDTMLMASVDVDQLQNKIEKEIDKLKNFRDAFLKEEETYTVETMTRTDPAEHQYRTQTRAATDKSDDVHRNPHPMSSEDFPVKPYFRTISVMRPLHGSSDSDFVESGQRRDADRDSDGGGKHVLETSSKPRICGGCIYGCNDNPQMLHSVYQKDYRQCTCPPQPKYMSCAVQCSPCPCYQYPHGSCRQPMMLLEPTPCQMPERCRPVQSVRKRRTDLDTELVCMLRRMETSSAGTQIPSQTKETARGRGLAKERTKNETATKITARGHEKIMKISYRKQPSQVSGSSSSRGIENMVKRYMASTKRTEDVPTTGRMHQEYLKMYAEEQQKTIRKMSSQNSSELDKCPTYTIIAEQKKKTTTKAKPCSTALVDRPPSPRQEARDCQCLARVRNMAADRNGGQRLDDEDSIWEEQSYQACSLTVKDSVEPELELELPSEPETVWHPCASGGSTEKVTSCYKSCLTEPTERTSTLRSCMRSHTLSSQCTRQQSSPATTSNHIRHQAVQTHANYAYIQYPDSIPCNSLPATENKRSSIPWHNLITLQSKPRTCQCARNKALRCSQDAPPNYCQSISQRHGHDEEDPDTNYESYSSDLDTEREYVSDSFSQPSCSQSRYEDTQRTLMSNMLLVPEKRKRSVTFEDQSCPSHGAAYKMDQHPMTPSELSMRSIQLMDEPNSEDDYHLDCCHSSSTLDTERTCQDSQNDDVYYSCSGYGSACIPENVIPPYTGCPCMRDEYMQLASYCKPMDDLLCRRPPD